MSGTGATLLSRLNPAVPRRYLYFLAGVLWTVAGALLCVRAVIWLDAFSFRVEVTLESISFALSVVAYLFVFARLVKKNLDRIATLPERVCLFAFTPWRGYIMIALMISIGMTLRNTSIPKYYLAVPYTAMGGTLLLGSYRFYHHFRLMSEQTRS